MRRHVGSAPDHVPSEWAARYGKPGPGGPVPNGMEVRLLQVRRAARRDVHLLTLAGSLCLLVLLGALGWTAATPGLALGATGIALGVAFATCVVLVHRTCRRRADRSSSPARD